MTDQDEDDYGMMLQMRLWDKKLSRLPTEMLTYVQQRAYSIQEYRMTKLNKEEQ